MVEFGVGIITTQDRHLSERYLNLIDRDTVIAVELDLERRGVAQTRNRVMKKLYDMGCKYITLFDDDCYPVKKGWQSLLVQCSLDSRAEVLVMPKNDHEMGCLVGSVENVRWGIGAFTFLTRSAMSTLGYYNSAYDTYGYEDVAYLYRARKAGLTVLPDYDSAPIGISKYIYSVDCDMDVEEKMSPLSVGEKQAYIEKNKSIFNEEVGSGKIYYPFGE